MPKPGSGLHGLTVYLLFNKAWDGDTKCKNQNHWIILIFSEKLTSVQYSLKTWHPRENWPGLELFLMLSERLKTKKKLQKFLVLMWLRKASTTFPHVLTQPPMPDAMLLWVVFILFLPSSASTQLNSTSTQIEAGIALFSGFPATHPPSHPPTRDSSF